MRRGFPTPLNFFASRIFPCPIDSSGSKDNKAPSATKSALPSPLLLLLLSSISFAFTPLSVTHRSGTPITETMAQPQSQPRIPTYFISHGGGPLPLLNDSAHTPIITHWKKLGASFKPTPKALLVVSAHWEEKEPTVTTSEHHPLFYDYYGFPPESYKITYPASGSPSVAARVQELLGSAGIPCHSEAKRGWDHGVFVPLKIIFPKADIPVVQLSLQASLDPAKHVAMGRALMPLRDEGVLILGSGFSFHNMAAFFSTGGDALPRSRAFNEYLIDAATQHVGEERNDLLTAWRKAPHASFCHPREEHLIPLLVVAGAAGRDAGAVAMRELLRNIDSVDFVFGADNQGGECA